MRKNSRGKFPTKHRRKMKNNRILIAVIAVLLAALLILAYVATRLDREGEKLPSETTASVPQTDGTMAKPTTQAPTTVPPATQTVAPTTEPALPTTQLPEPEDADFVRIRDYIPDIVVDLKYAAEDNFTGQVIYEFTEAYLRYGTVKKLMAVQEALKSQGLGLKIWDGFRPVSAQEKLWQVCPDPTYVSPPGTGTQSHCRGIAVDITLVDATGAELVMPTGFDDFSALADRDYADCTAEAANNARLLEKLMEENGFKPYFGEWWHYADTVSYDVAKDFEP